MMVEKFWLNQDDKVRVVQTLLFVEGINTLLQTLFGTRLPTVIGGFYAFLVPIISIIHDSKLTKIEDLHIVSVMFFPEKEKKNVLILSDLVKVWKTLTLNAHIF